MSLRSWIKEVELSRDHVRGIIATEQGPQSNHIELA